MFLLNKVSSKGPSPAEESAEMENTENMPTPEKPRTRERKGSRIRASLFGGRRKSLDVPAVDGPEDGFKLPLRTYTEDAEGASIHSRRSRLRKMTSKSSLNSMSTASFSTESLFRSSSPQHSQPIRPKHISGPYNFTHLTQMNPGDASRLRINQEMGEEWNRALHRESKSRPGTAQTCFPSHLRVESADPIRQRSNSTQSLSPMQTFPEVPASPTEQTCPITLPVRTSSRRVVDHPADADHQSHDEVDDSLVAVPEEEEDQHADGGIGYAVTTSEDTCFGETSIGVEKLLGLDMGEEEANALERTATSTNVPQIRETQSTPDLTVTAEDDMVYRPQMYLSVRPRPLSQLSQLSDTLNGSFIVPPSPIHGSRRRSKRISCRLSTHMKLNGSFTLDEATIDSWEEDIDWCYENEAEANCDFDWDHDLQNAAGNPNDEPQSFSPAPVLETAAFEIPIPKSELLEIPEEIKEETAEEELVINEKRITGLFEDRLLLPPSPRFPPSSFGGFPRARDSGFEGGNTDDQSMLMRAGNNALRHRSITTSTDLSMRSYREELFRVARQLDEHIAALNQELGGSPFNSPPMSPLSRPTVPDDISLFSGKRQRADSQTTCVTLCSDTDTITHFETHEVITPASSAHNSFHFTKQRASSVTGAGYAVEGRSEKGLSFPAAAIPGVVELGPGDFDALCAEEPEFVHFI